MQIAKLSMPLSLCIINYNGENYLEETLTAVVNQKNIFSEIILIDNASEDNGIELVISRFPDIKIIQLNKNYGPASARNTGYNAASSDLILFIDNDICLADDFSDNLECALKQDTNMTIGMPQVHFALQRSKIQYNGASCHFLGHMILEGENNDHSNFINGTKKIDSVVTSCFFINKKNWGPGKPFDDSFFFNYEDHDFGFRTRIKGLDILSLYSLHCFHKEGTPGLSRREGWNYSRQRVYYLIRNRWQIILKDYQFRTILILLPIFFIYEIFQLAAVIKKGWLIEWLKAVSWTVLNFPQILLKRRMIQKSRKIPDHEILKGGPIPFFKDLPQSCLEKSGKYFLDYLAELYWKKIKAFI